MPSDKRIILLYFLSYLLSHNYKKKKKLEIQENISKSSSQETQNSEIHHLNNQVFFKFFF
jgi:hypothetical protein